MVNQQWLGQNQELVETIRQHIYLGNPQLCWKQDDTLIAAWLPDGLNGSIEETIVQATSEAEEVSDAQFVRRLADLINDIGAGTAFDVRQIGGLGEHHGTVQTGAILAYPENIFIGEGAVIRSGAILNAEFGPIHLAANATVEENAVVRGPVFLGEGSFIKAGARVDGSSIGPGCKVGGEVHESIIHSYSNKAHDGYLGNSYLGRWCNLGADTNTSNLKNDYGEVTLFDAPMGDFLPSGRQFAGLFMGDHSKCSINTMFNTGTVVGVFCNLFGSGFPARHIPSFSWGTDAIYKLEKAFRVAETVMARRGINFTAGDRALLEHVFASTRPSNSQ